MAALFLKEESPSYITVSYENLFGSLQPDNTRWFLREDSPTYLPSKKSDFAKQILEFLLSQGMTTEEITTQTEISQRNITQILEGEVVILKPEIFSKLLGLYFQY